MLKNLCRVSLSLLIQASSGVFTSPHGTPESSLQATKSEVRIEPDGLSTTTTKMTWTWVVDSRMLPC